MIEPLLAWDRWLLWKVNVEMANSILDQVMPVLSNLHSEPWVLWVIGPGLLLRWSWRYLGFFPKGLLAMVLAIVLTDSLCHRVLKPLIGRPRPDAAQLDLEERARAGGLYSFPSNHAANSFAAVTALQAITHEPHPWFVALAVGVAFSRVYLGVHYPLDVVGGAAVGWLVAWLTIRLLAQVDRWRGGRSRFGRSIFFGGRPG